MIALTAVSLMMELLLSSLLAPVLGRKFLETDMTVGMLLLFMLEWGGIAEAEFPVPLSFCFARLMGDANSFTATIAFPATMMNQEIMRGTAKAKRTRKYPAVWWSGKISVILKSQVDQSGL